MTFGGHIVNLILARVVKFSARLRSEGEGLTTRAKNKQYDPTKVMLLTLLSIYKANNYT